MRRAGNDSELTELATANALAIGAGHCFIVFLREGCRLNVLNQVKQLPEVCRIFCATANPVQVIVAATEQGRAVLGIVDGVPPRLAWKARGTSRPAGGSCAGSATSNEGPLRARLGRVGPACEGAGADRVLWPAGLEGRGLGPGGRPRAS